MADQDGDVDMQAPTDQPTQHSVQDPHAVGAGGSDDADAADAANQAPLQHVEQAEKLDDPPLARAVSADTVEIDTATARSDEIEIDTDMMGGLESKGYADDPLGADDAVVVFRGGPQDWACTKHMAFASVDDRDDAQRCNRTVQTEVLTWGRGEEGQLMAGTTEQQLVPSAVHKLDRHVLVDIACSSFQTLVVTTSGEVMAAGDNSEGQLLQDSQVTYILTPTRLETLSTQQAVQVSAGASHAAVLLSTGAVVTFGVNEHGQLGHSEDKVYRVAPRAMKGLRHPIIQVACGELHTLLLDRYGSVYACGCGAQGALGLGDRDNRKVATVIAGLAGVPVAQIAAGASHSAAVSVSGTVFTWGRNKYGQLGLPRSQFPQCAYTPQCVSTIDVCIQHVSCGGNHTAFVARNGKLFMAGRGHNGCLGLPEPVEAQDVPISPPAFDHMFVRQAATGAQHTVIITADGLVYGFGSNQFGQIGVSSDTVNVYKPTLIQQLSHAGVFHIHAGGDHSVALRVVRGSVLSRPPGTLPRGTLAGVTAPEAVLALRNAEATQNFTPVKATLQDVMCHVSSLNASMRTDAADVFFKVSAPRPPHTDALAITPASGRTLMAPAFGSDAPATTDHAASMYFSVGSSPIGIVTHPVTELADCRSHATSNVDIPGVEQLYTSLLRSSNPDLVPILIKSMETAVAEFAELAPSVQDPDALRAVVILLLNPLHGGPSRCGVLPKLCAAVSKLSDACLTVLTRWLYEEVPTNLLITRIVRPLQVHLSLWLNTDRNVAAPIVALLWRLRTYCDNVPAQEFYNSAIANMPDQVLGLELTKWWEARSPIAQTAPTHGNFSVCAFPFLIDAATKRRLVRMESNVRMSQGVNPFWGMVPYLPLIVRRDHLVTDVLNQVARLLPHQLRMPIKVTFVGEEGVDEGGVKKELFQLLVRQMFDVAYGMFTYDTHTRRFWFAPGDHLEFDAFRLIGMVLGLAIYNGVILDVHLPLAVYKRLLGGQLTFADLKEVSPTVGKSLQDLLDYPGNDVEDVFCLAFEATYEQWGETKTVELLPNGSNKPVTNDNRETYVELYTRWFMETSVREQMQQFVTGFLLVMDGPTLKMFTPVELEQLVCGTPELDFKALQRVTVYDGGYTPDHPAIAWFWDIVHSWTDQQRSQLLQFSTGCAKAPIGGLGNLPFKIQRNGGPETTRLPTAATCFNTLLLPEYRSPAVMRKALETAIAECEGFGLM